MDPLNLHSEHSRALSMKIAITFECSLSPSQMVLVVKILPANLKDAGLIPGSGISPGGGHGNPFQYSCLENPVDKRSLAGYSP